MSSECLTRIKTKRSLNSLRIRVSVVTCISALMVELVDILDLGSSAEMRVGSNPTGSTIGQFDERSKSVGCNPTP